MANDPRGDEHVANDSRGGERQGKQMTPEVTSVQRWRAARQANDPRGDERRGGERQGKQMTPEVTSVAAKDPRGDERLVASGMSK